MTVAKVKKLLALAAQDNEEGRTAAWLAAKMIREEKLSLVGDGAGAAPPPPPPPPRPAPPPVSNPFEDLFRGYGVSNPFSYAPPRRPPPPAPTYDDYATTMSFGDGTERVCWNCKGRIPPGIPHWNQPNKSPICTNCVGR